MREERDFLAIIVGELWDRPPAEGEDRDRFDIGLAYTWGYRVMQVWRRLCVGPRDDEGFDRWILADPEPEEPTTCPS